MICTSAGSPAIARSSQSRHPSASFREAVHHERLQGERGVAEPDEAVVPVAHAAERLGQARRRGRDDAAGVLVREGAQHEQRAPHDVVVSPRSSKCDAQLRHSSIVRVSPSSTSIGGGGSRCDGYQVNPMSMTSPSCTSNSPRCARPWGVSLGPRMTMASGPATASSARARAVPDGRGREPAAPRGSSPRSRSGCAAPAPCDGAPDAGDPPHDVRASVAERHEVGHLDLARVARPPGDEDEGVVEVAPRGGARGADRAQGPVPVLLGPEQRAERRRGVEARKAEPVDAAVESDERRGVAVADQRVVLDPERHRPARRVSCRRPARGAAPSRRR